MLHTTSQLNRVPRWVLDGDGRYSDTYNLLKDWGFTAIYLSEDGVHYGVIPPNAISVSDQGGTEKVVKRGVETLFFFKQGDVFLTLP